MAVEVYFISVIAMFSSHLLLEVDSEIERQKWTFTGPANYIIYRESGGTNKAFNLKQFKVWPQETSYVFII